MSEISPAGNAVEVEEQHQVARSGVWPVARPAGFGCERVRHADGRTWLELGEPLGLYLTSGGNPRIETGRPIRSFDPYELMGLDKGGAALVRAALFERRLLDGPGERVPHGIDEACTCPTAECAHERVRSFLASLPKGERWRIRDGRAYMPMTIAEADRSDHVRARIAPSHEGVLMVPTPDEMKLWRGLDVTLDLWATDRTERARYTPPRPRALTVYPSPDKWPTAKDYGVTVWPHTFGDVGGSAADVWRKIRDAEAPGILLHDEPWRIGWRRAQWGPRRSPVRRHGQAEQSSTPCRCCTGRAKVDRVPYVVPGLIKRKLRQKLWDENGNAIASSIARPVEHARLPELGDTFAANPLQTLVDALVADVVKARLKVLCESARIPKRWRVTGGCSRGGSYRDDLLGEAMTELYAPRFPSRASAPAEDMDLNLARAFERAKKHLADLARETDVTGVAEDDPGERYFRAGVPIGLEGENLDDLESPVPEPSRDPFLSPTKRGKDNDDANPEERTAPGAADPPSEAA